LDSEKNKLKKEQVAELKKNDFDGEETLRLLDANDLVALEITKGLRKLLEKAIKDFQGCKTELKGKDLITTSALAKDSGLNALLHQVENEGSLDAIITGSSDTTTEAAQPKTVETYRGVGAARY